MWPSPAAHPSGGAQLTGPVASDELSRLRALVATLEYNFKHVVDSNERLDQMINHRFSALERDVADQKVHSRRQSRDIQELGRHVYQQGYDYKGEGADENSAPNQDKGFYTQGRKSHDARAGGGRNRGGFRNAYESRNGYGRGQYNG